ncbi:unnamed protein product [Ceutorhynchus assimilis]|uniref:Protein kinase domain-containing protein n=1 Tax=Ceutorhynchus assimilis TaxID=467358 RepID=A0A9N9QN58_9CUCU|nr:unnamed protein product [Ceutorhynchus assimilis]
MATNIHQSRNYVWSTDDILGRGSTCSVYKGINKNNGEFVAIKVVEAALGVREFEMLKKIKHENIVKLLSIEQECPNRNSGRMQPRQILVTELCTGGCLSNILDDPENIYGLDDSEFLLFLSHLYAGMKYLRDNDIVHRDLKPGNIMKCILDDGTSVYKLIDFGAARDLPDGKEFVSVYGTEEYLAPDVYERALLGTPGRAFRATVDLWSTGVTLYHVVTGELPFRPFGGRRNRQTMHYITTHKKAGIISGIQQNLNGSIIWSSKLPENCLLSPNLRKIITPLIAGLLESDVTKIWTFKEFFDTVDTIVTRKIVHVFDINNQGLIKIYLNPFDTIEILQKDISIQTDIAPENQILIYKADELSGETLLATTEKCPVFVFSKENSKINVLDLKEMSPIISFTKKLELGEDFKLARKACCNAYQAKRLIEKYSIITQLIHNTVENVIKCIKIRLKKLMCEAEYLMSKCKIFNKAAGIFETLQNVAKYKAKTNNCEELSNISQDFVAIYNLHTKYNYENLAEKEWESAIKDFENPFESRLTVRASTLADRIKDSMNHLRIGRDYPLPQNHQYQLECIKIAKTWTHLHHLLETVAYHQYTTLIKVFESWFNKVQKDYMELETLSQTINEFKVNLNKFEDKFDVDVDEFNEYLKANPNNNEPTEKIKYVKDPVLHSRLKNKLKTYNYKTGNNLIAENSELINKLKECTSDLDGNKFDLEDFI